MSAEETSVERVEKKSRCGTCGKKVLSKTQQWYNSDCDSCGKDCDSCGKVLNVKERLALSDVLNSARLLRTHVTYGMSHSELF